MEVINDYNNKKPIKMGIISGLFVVLLILAILIAFLYIINIENKKENNISETQIKTEGESLTREIIATTLTSCINSMMSDSVLELAQKHIEESDYIENDYSDHNNMEENYSEDEEYDIDEILSKTEINAFNSIWLEYEGEQKGAQIKTIINQMIAHANTYRDEPEKIIKVKYIDEQNVEKTIECLEELTIYISELNNLYTQIISKATYEVGFEYEGEKIHQIIIKYSM